MNEPQILVLGCGNRKRPDAVHIDIRENCNPDVVWDLNRFPWPFPDDRFGEIVCEHIFEHLEDVPAVLREIYRIARHGAGVQVVTPHFSSSQSWDDPTHRHHFTLKSFDYFNPSHPHSDGTMFFKVVEKNLSFSRSYSNLPGRFHYRLSPNRYEKRYAFRYPARNIRLKLEVVKEQT